MATFDPLSRPQLLEERPPMGPLGSQAGSTGRAVLPAVLPEGLIWPGEGLGVREDHVFHMVTKPRAFR